MNWIDFIGYAASFFVVISFLFKNNVVLIRSTNLIGCVLFVIYGYFIDSIPVIIPNGILVFIQLYHIITHKK